MNEPKYGTFHDAATGETITRELTAEEIAALPEPAEPLTPAPE
jgi:hypothetical protein